MKKKIYLWFCIAVMCLTGCGTISELETSSEAVTTVAASEGKKDGDIIVIPTSTGNVLQTTEYAATEIASEIQQETTATVVTMPAETSADFQPVEGSRLIVIDPGHGGTEYGACYNGYVEKELSLKVGLYLRQYLLDNYYGIQIIMTRETDVCFSQSAKEDLQARCDVAANNGAEYLISLHFNADGVSHTSSGALICASKAPGLKAACETLGNLVLSKLELLGLPNQTVHFRDSDTYFYADGSPMDYYAINRHCAEYGIPSIIIEHAFIDNPSETVFFDSDEKLYNMAVADATAIAEYFGLVHK